MLFSLHSKKTKIYQYGFTFIEVTIVTAIASTLIGVAILNLLNIHQTKTVQSISEILISDLRSQQTKTMSLSTQNGATSDNYGIFFGTNSYFLFKGSIYDINDPSNSEITLPSNFNFASVTLPNNQIVFLKGSGEVQDYIESLDSLRIRNADNKNTKTVEINKYGVVNYN